MDNELKSIIPAIGVIVGWALNELSQYFKGQREDRRLINKSFSPLLDLLFIINQKRSLLKSALKSNKLIHVNVLGGLFDNEKFGSINFNKTLLQATKNLAEIDPILSLELSTIAESMHLFKQISDLESPDRQELEGKYKTLIVFSKHLDRLINRLLIKHSIRMRLRYEIYKRKNLKENDVWDTLFQNYE